MKQIIHIEKNVCDVCGKEVDELVKHSVIGKHYMPSDYQGASPIFLGYKEYEIEMCRECEKKLVDVMDKHYARVSKCNYDPELYVRGTKDE